MRILARQNGISLVELLVALSIVALTLTLGVPNFYDSRTSVHRNQAMLGILSSLTLARSEAARRAVSVRVCASDNGLACSGANPPVWEDGWIVFTDVDGDGTLDAGTDEMIHTEQFGAPKFTLTPDNGLLFGVLFNGNGFPDATGDFTYCDARESRVYNLGFVGRAEQISTGAGCP